LTSQTTFSGRCPQCKGYNTRIKTDVLNYSSQPPADGEEQRVVSRTRIYICNACQHNWSETMQG
jgi:hypothetical protein